MLIDAPKSCGIASLRSDTSAPPAVLNKALQGICTDIAVTVGLGDSSKVRNQSVMLDHIDLATFFFDETDRNSIAERHVR